MGTNFSISRTIKLYNNIWYTSPQWLISIIGISITSALLYMLLLSKGNYHSMQFQTLAITTSMTQIFGLSLIRTSIYNNGITFFTTPSRPEERLAAMFMTLITNFTLTVAACYVGFILWSLIDTNAIQALQIEDTLHPGLIEKNFFHWGDIYLFNPAAMVPVNATLQLSASDINYYFTMISILPTFSYLAIFFSVILTRNQWITLSAYLLLIITSMIILFNFIASLFEKPEMPLWQTICLSPYFYASLTIVVIGLSLYKLKYKQIL